MIAGRWYPGLVRLPDERLMILGGELDGPARRTNGCEIIDPRSNTWTNTGSFGLPTEIPPAVVLYTGEVLKTWRYPELYNIGSGMWRPAANMLQNRIGQSNGDHSDHEIVHLPEGRVMAVGVFPAVTKRRHALLRVLQSLQQHLDIGTESARPAQPPRSARPA